MDDKTEKMAEYKADAISLIAKANSFLVIADNGKICEKRLCATEIGSVLVFLREMETIKNQLLFPTPPPSNIIKT